MFTLRALAVVVFSLAAAATSVAVPIKIAQQGRLLDELGDPVDGAVTLTFRLYSDSTGGSPIWEEAQLVDIEQGLYTVYLGSTEPLELDHFYVDHNLWLGLKVDPDPEMVPRIEMVALALAGVAQRVLGDRIEVDVDLDSTHEFQVIPHPTLPLNPPSIWAFPPGGMRGGYGFGWDVDPDSSDDFILAESPRKAVFKLPLELDFDDDDSSDCKFGPGSFEWDVDDNDSADIIWGDPEDPEAKFLIPIRCYSMLATTNLDAAAGGRITMVAGSSLSLSGFGGSSLKLSDPDAGSIDMVSGSGGSIFVTSSSKMVFTGAGGSILRMSDGLPGRVDLSSSSGAPIFITSSASMTCASITTSSCTSGGDMDLTSTGGLVRIVSSSSKIVLQGADSIKHQAPVIFMAASNVRLTGNCQNDGNMFVGANCNVNGALTVSGPKMFVQDHPKDPTKEIYYVALEGNEAGTYSRGSARLVKGRAVIDLPKDFALVTNSEGLTVQITPNGRMNGMLFVETKSTTQIVVSASNASDRDVPFDYLVQGVRAGYEDHEVIRTKRTFSSVDPR